MDTDRKPWPKDCPWPEPTEFSFDYDEDFLPMDPDEETQDLIEINSLQEKLQDAKYKALSSSSLMTERSRESNVLEMLKDSNDSTLKTPNQPPYIITIPEE